MKKHFKLYYLLIPLAFLLLTPWIATRLSSIATHSSTEALAYKFAIPLLGFFAGAAFFLLRLDGKFQVFINWLYSQTMSRAGRIVVILTLIHAALFACLAILRYTSFHCSYFDMTIELNKIWLATRSSPLELLSHILRFQPLIYLYSSLYQVLGSPLPLFVLQSLLTYSAVIPLYLLARQKLGDPLFTVAVCVLFLIYPPVQYNSFNDLHLDHLCIPLLMWAFYYAEREKYLGAILFTALTGMVKEPLMPGLAFFGLYLALGKKKYFLGAAVFVAFSVLFFYITFVLIPSVAPPSAGGGSVINSGSYSYLITAHKQYFLPVIKEALGLKKIIYLIFLLLPFLFLPVFSPAALLPAIPVIAISILSTTPEHSTVNSQYTVGVIPPVFAAMVLGLAKVQERWDIKMAEAVMGWVIVLTVSFNIAHSPAPTSVNFWSKEGAGGIYNYSQYRLGEHEKILGHVINELVPRSADTRIVFHSKIADMKLSSRYQLKPFPLEWEQAEYILLDHTRFPMVIDKIDEKAYWQGVQDVEDSGMFHKTFDKDGVVLYSRPAFLPH